MASITGSTTNLVTWGASVSGVSASYDHKGFFDAVALGTVVFPCLLAMPDLGQQTGWQAIAFQGNAPQVEFIMEHYLLFSKVAATADFTVISPLITTALDNYLSALKANPMLTVGGVPGTHMAPLVSYRVAKSNWSGVQYHSIIFQLKLKLYL